MKKKIYIADFGNPSFVPAIAISFRFFQWRGYRVYIISQIRCKIEIKTPIQ